MVVVDEVHAQPNRELIDVLTTSTASLNRSQPLTVYISTADYNRPSICNEKYEYAKRVMAQPEIDPRFLPVLYEASPADDWTDERTWEKANPNLDVSVSREYLRRECAKAKELPEYENTFKRLHLDLRTDADVRWLSSVLWDANAGPVDAEALRGRSCFAGLDLANTLDVAALVLVFPPTEEGDPWQVLPFFWVPEEVCLKRERQNRTRYDAWVSKGYMTKTPGDVIDYSLIRKRLNELAKVYRIQKLAFDPYNATHLSLELVGDGIDCEQFTQTLTNYNAPSVRLEELLSRRELHHGGNPVLSWMAGNVALHTDGRGYKMPSRKKSADKIDGIAALVMALAVAAQGEAKPSIYETRGMLVL